MDEMQKSEDLRPVAEVETISNKLIPQSDNEPSREMEYEGSKAAFSARDKKGEISMLCKEKYCQVQHKEFVESEEKKKVFDIQAVRT